MSPCQRPLYKPLLPCHEHGGIHSPPHSVTHAQAQLVNTVLLALVPPLTRLPKALSHISLALEAKAHKTSQPCARNSPAMMLR